MAVVVMFMDGTYFRKTGRNTRKRVTDLQKATTWEHAGHAKAALRALYEYTRNLSNSAHWPTDFQIVKVKMAKFGQRENLSWKDRQIVPRVTEPPKPDPYGEGFVDAGLW